jgi:hypothetical protein
LLVKQQRDNVQLNTGTFCVDFEVAALAVDESAPPAGCDEASARKGAFVRLTTINDLAIEASQTDSSTNIEFLLL